jgi:hypothetical protein
VICHDAQAPPPRLLQLADTLQDLSQLGVEIAGEAHPMGVPVVIEIARLGPGHARWIAGLVRVQRLDAIVGQQLAEVV